MDVFDVRELNLSCTNYGNPFPWLRDTLIGKEIEKKSPIKTEYRNVFTSIKFIEGT